MPINMPQKRVTLSTLMPFLAIPLYIFCIFFSIHVKKTTLSSCSNTTITLSLTQNLELASNFSLLIGILTLADNYERRHFLRLIYGTQLSPWAQIDVKFVFCNLTKPEKKTLIALEIMRYKDIIILNCNENMNNGKTYNYLSSLPRILPRHYDYIMKADDDVFIRLSPLALSLSPLPRIDMYYGFVSGMGFVLSWDLVEWISNFDISENNTFGPEDKVVGKCLNVGMKAKNRYTNKPIMYDYPGTNSSHDLIPDMVAVHRLKKWDQWLHVIRFFNVTKQLKPSKLYHV